MGEENLQDVELMTDIQEATLSDLNETIRNESAPQETEEIGIDEPDQMEVEEQPKRKAIPSWQRELDASRTSRERVNSPYSLRDRPRKTLS